MFKVLKFPITFLIVLFLLFGNFFFQINALTFDNSYIFLERMQTGTQTGMILMITPTSSFDSPGEIKITFLSDIGEWCLNNSSLNVTGVASSPVDVTGWEIGEALPTETTLQANCVSGDPLTETNDFIVIQNVGNLIGGVSYGLKIDENVNLRTSSTSGSKKMMIELNDGINSAVGEISVNIIPSDSVNFEAFVSEMSTLTCTVSNSNISFGALSRGGTYITRQHSLSIESSLLNGHYWAVYGQGDGNQAGLWKSTTPTSLIVSTGTTMNLSQNPGFGLNVSSVSGIIPNDFNNTTSGMFGSINSGSPNSRLIFWETTSLSSNATITLGARAGVATEVGPHSETLTYLCGSLY